MIYSFDELSFQILTVGHFFHRNGVYDVKPRPFAAFSFRISGTADFEIDNKHFTSSAGDILFLPANMGYKVKYSSDPKSLLRAIAEDPITPAEAIIKVKAAYFPTTALTERLTQLDTNPNVYNDVHTGDLVLDSNGKITANVNGLSNGSTPKKGEVMTLLDTGKVIFGDKNFEGQYLDESTSTFNSGDFLEAEGKIYQEAEDIKFKIIYRKQHNKNRYVMNFSIIFNFTVYGHIKLLVYKIKTAT